MWPHFIHGSQQVLETRKTRKFEFYMSRSKNSLEFAPQSKKKNLDKIRNLAEKMDKTWNVKTYKISILYWDTILQVVCSC